MAFIVVSFHWTTSLAVADDVKASVATHSGMRMAHSRVFIMTSFHG